MTKAKISETIEQQQSEATRLLDLWYQHPVGERLLQSTQTHLQLMLNDTFGYQAIQTGLPHTLAPFLSAASHIPLHHYMGLTSQPCDAYARAEALPFAHDSVDLVISAHSLEFSPAPHQLLREIERVLTTEGHCIIIAFNPLSIKGLQRLLHVKNRQYRGHYYTFHRIRDWLHLLGFEILEHKRLGYRPAFVHTEKLLQHTVFFEHLGEYCWPILGTLYIIHARKRRITLTPRHASWQISSLLAGAYPKPHLPRS